MGELFRSEEMQMVQLFVQLEAAHDTFDELGHLGVIQFRDLNPHMNSFHRAFVSDVRRVDEMDRKLDYFENQLKAEDEADNDAEKEPFKIDYDEFDHVPTSASEIAELESRLEELERDLIQANNNQEMLKRNYNELTELRHVLRKDNEFFEQVRAEFSSFYS